MLGLVSLRHAVELRGVDIAQRVDLAELGGVLDVALALAADADAAELNLFVGRLAFRGMQSAGDPIADARGRRSLKKRTSIRYE